MNFQISGNGVVDLADGTFIAPGAGGWRAQQYQAWLAEGNVPAPAALADLQVAQITLLGADYAAAITLPVSFTSAAGVAQTYQADEKSVANLVKTRLAFAPPASMPPGFYWVAADNTPVPFTYADLQGLSLAMGAQGWADFARLQARRSAVLAAAADQVASVTW